MLAQSKEALVARRRAYSLDPRPDRHTRLLMAMQYAGDPTPTQLLETHREWDSDHARQFLPPESSKRSRSSKPLRLGFISQDFARHPIAFLASPAFQQLTKLKCPIVCYSDRPAEDEYTDRFRGTAEHWRKIADQTDEDVAKQIRQDEIDILVDLMGHTGNRLLVFARKPAPVQVTWLGYVGTTGLTAMDYLLADRFHVRPGEEEYYTEKVLRMPNGYACYGPPEDAPQVGPLPALRNATEGVPYRAGRVTFGCFNNPAKYAPSILDAWAEILRRLPGARLLLKYGGLGDPQMQQRLRGEFARRGVDAGRIVLEGWSPHRELLAAYNRVDLALDTQPYSGGLTTCEALWMGVPVITIPGKTFAGRHSVSHLTNAGYPQFIAADAAGYVELALYWANHLGELAAIRREMREKVSRSPLCDASQFAGDFLAVLRQAWQCQESGSR
jgi:predicted O-linked N-acetylglucosamine transferase (SPINDLY family)